MTKKLFIGLNMPAGELPEIVEAQKRLIKNADQKNISVKWSPPENYHVTLKYFGHTDVDLIPKIIASMDQITHQHPPLCLKLSGIGAFPDDHHARVIWVGVQNSRDLRFLQGQLETGFTPLGLEKEQREYTPHLTIGRLRNSRSIKDMVSPLVRKKFGKVSCRDIVLYESKMQGAFPIYIPIHSSPLQEDSVSTTTP